MERTVQEVVVKVGEVRATMTLIGFSVSGNHAFAWCDSELLAGGEPLGRHATKMVVNPLAGVVGITSGYHSTGRKARELIATVLSFDEAVGRLRARLEQCLYEDGIVDRIGARARSDQYECCAIVGFSHFWNRVAGAVFESTRDYAPRAAISFQAPEVGECSDVANCDQDVVAIAQQQLLDLGRAFPGLSGGVLTIAEVSSGAVSCRQAFDLERGVMLGLPLAFTRAGEARRPIQQAAPGADGQSPQEPRQPAGEHGSMEETPWPGSDERIGTGPLGWTTSGPAPSAPVAGLDSEFESPAMMRGEPDDGQKNNGRPVST